MQNSLLIFAGGILIGLLIEMLRRPSNDCKERYMQMYYDVKSDIHNEVLYIKNNWEELDFNKREGYIDRTLDLITSFQHLIKKRKRTLIKEHQLMQHDQFIDVKYGKILNASITQCTEMLKFLNKSYEILQTNGIYYFSQSQINSTYKEFTNLIGPEIIHETIKATGYRWLFFINNNY